MHYRQRIRDAVAAQVLNRTAAQGNVFTSRARPVLEILNRREAVLSVYTSEETSERTGDGFNLRRTLMVSIEGMAGGGDNLDDVLDDFATEVESAILLDPTLQNLLAEDMVLESTTVEIGAKGSMQVGAFRMDFSAVYTTEWTGLGPEPAGLPPREVFTAPQPNADAYVAPIEPVPGNSGVCVDGTCAPDAWGGDLSDEGGRLR